jgi:hypothetical protein
LTDQVHGGLPAYRERVYCYELYHQMRRRWPLNCEYSLNGEVDKRGHPYLQARPDLRSVIPDPASTLYRLGASPNSRRLGVEPRA